MTSLVDSPHRTRLHASPLVALLTLLAAVSHVSAGGPRAVNGLGEPMRWDTAGPVIYNPDPGPLGLLNSASARALLAEAFAEWAAGSAAITFTEGPPLSLDVNATGFAFSNPAHYQNFYRVDGDGKSPVIFDHDGSIIDSLFGVGARFEILGVAAIDTPIGLSTVITGASVIINGAFYDGAGMPASPDDVTLTGLKATMVHEIGHSINLDHSVLNHELALDDNAGNDTYVPTMFPIAVQDEEALATTNPDDELAAQNLYPAGSGQTISGSVSFAGLPFQGANVVLRNTGDPLMTAYSVISGGSFFPCNPASTCDPCTTVCDPGNPPEQGEFVASFLPAGSYRVCVEQIDTRFSESNNTFIGPLATPPIMPGPEECYDAAEGATSADDPDEVLAVTGGGGPIDLLLNALPSSDSFEPNNTLSTGATLADLAGGADTVPGFLGTGDLDVFNVPVTAGQRIRIDLDADEMGSSLDSVVGFYNASNILVAFADDSVDPDSRAFSRDPALELIAPFTGTGKVVVSSFPDFDQDGAGGSTTGGYWLQVEVASDADGDGAPDLQDICPASPRDDTDRDGVCFGADNCPTASNPLQDAPVKISGSLVAGGDVSFFAITPDGTWVVSVGDQDEDEVFQIYSMPIDGGSAPVRLNPSLAGTGKDVEDFLISPDGATVVYLADQSTDGTLEIYSVPVAGGTATKLNGTLQTGGRVWEFNMSPDNARVVYRAEQDTIGVDELYSVLPSGGATTRLNGTMTPGGTMVHPGAGFSSFIFSEDSSRVVYAADQDTDDVLELYSVPITGGTATKLNGSLTAGGDVANFQTNKIATRILFTADNITDQLLELYSVPLGGGTITKLSGSMAGGASGVVRFSVTPDGATAVYRADQGAAGLFELYSVPVTGGTPTKLNPTLVANGDVFGFALPVGIADGNRLTYRADQDVDEQFEIYSVAITGGTAIKLNAPLVSGGDVTQQGGGVYNSTVLFVADQDVDEQFELYSVPATGGTPVELTGTMIANGDYKFTNFDADKVAVRADKFADEEIELFGTRLAGGVPLKLNATLVAGGDVIAQDFTSGSIPERIVYQADQDTDEVFELYSRPFSLDTDADSVFDQCDVCIDASDVGQDDTDGNGLGDACETCVVGTDTDADDVCGAADNCPTVSNAGQSDFDTDGAGDACDADDDNDGLADVAETNTGTFVSAGNTGTNPLDSDSDNDGVSDGDEILAGTNPNVAASISSSIAFGGRRVVTGSAFGATSVFAADIDSDGDQDLLSASFGDGTIAWHENNGASPPGWTVRMITASPGTALSVFAADVDGDGDMDVLSADDCDGTVAWYENNGASPPGWTVRTIATSFGGCYSSVFAADVDGDGDMDVLSANYVSSEVAWYENDGASPPGWTVRLISTTAAAAWSVVAADVDGDGDMDAVSADHSSDTIAWYESNGASPPAWTRRTISVTAPGPYSVFAVDVDRDGDIDVLSASYRGNQVAWYENDGGSPPVWTPHVISTNAYGALSVYAADVDGDGDTDVLSASFDDGNVRWYENNGAPMPGFAARIIDAASLGASSVFAADADGDGDLDVLAASQNDNTVAWYENRAIHRNAAFPTESQVTLGFSDWINSVVAADVDGDGDMDVLSASGNDDKIAWYESNGASPPTFTARNIAVDVANFARTVFAADLDGDGDTDALSASWDLGESQGRIAWFENDGASPPVWTSHLVVTTIAESDPCENCLRPESAIAADVDGDGDQDIIAGWSSLDPVSWYENLDGAGTFGPAQVIYQFSGLGILSVAATDVDGDGDTDVVSGSRSGNKTAWYENDGTPGGLGDWAEHRISFPATIASVFAADVDGDGDMDVLSASDFGDEIAWYENDGTPAVGGDWTAHHIATLDFARAVFAIDMDGDGDMDALSASETEDRVVWYENSGASPPSWSEHSIINSLNYAVPVFAADMDKDGDTDVLCAEMLYTVITWYQNRGGQFTLDTAVPAGLPANIVEGSKTALLSITLTSNGRSGDSAVELATLALLVTDASGTTLSSVAANSLIERLRVYRDNGSGVFERDLDPLVATVETLELAPQVIEFAPGDPRVRVEPGQSRTFFVVAEISPSASAQSPGSFRLTHVTQSGSKARDAATGALLQMESASTSGTGTLTIVDDATPPFVTSSFPVDQAVDVSLSTGVVLFFNEPVDPASVSSGVALYVGGAKVPSAIAVSGPTVIIDPESNLSLDTDYLVQVTSQLHDVAGNPALPFVATFETTDSSGSGSIGASEIGESGGGATLAGSDANDNSGFANAALGDINGTATSGGIADFIVGAPNADAGAADAGKATLIFGAPGLQSNAGAVLSLTYRTATPLDFVGETVAQAGDLNGDTVRDFFIGAPHSDQTGADAGVVYLVFGNQGLDELAPATLDLDNLASCAAPTLCGVKFLGAAAGDLAGVSLSWAGDVNGDGHDDVVIGAPGASPGGRTGAGRVYLVYGPLAAGVIPLAQVGSTVPGLVFNGETAGDNLGASVSLWPDETGDGFDDLLLGAPGATSLDGFGVPIPNAGYVYALQGGESPGRLDDTATPGVIEMSRVASGGSDQVAGMVFIGTRADGNIGRSITGAVDFDGNGVNDILISGDGIAFSIPGDDPKTRVGATASPTQTSGGGLRAGLFDAQRDFKAVVYLTGNNDPLTVGPAGDLNNDGYDDFIIGAPLADTAAGVDAGRAYIILGSPAPGGDTRMLDDVGDTIDGFIVEGAGAGDNLGASVGGGYDLNADGVDDGLVGAPFADTAAATPSNAGETYVISPLRPNEVTGLDMMDLGAGLTRLEWSVTDLAVTYNVYRGLVSILLSAEMVKTSNMTQIACGISTDADADLLPDHDDASLPPAGDAWFYLVTGENGQGEGPLGPPGALPPHINDLQCP